MKTTQKTQTLRQAASKTIFPTWYRVKGVMKYISPSYEHTFLTPKGHSAKEYIGKKDYAVWDAKSAALFRSCDRQAEREGFSDNTKRIETAPGIYESYRCIKFAHNGGVWCVAIPVEEVYGNEAAPFVVAASLFNMKKEIKTLTGEIRALTGKIAAQN